MVELPAFADRDSALLPDVEFCAYVLFVPMLMLAGAVVVRPASVFDVLAEVFDGLPGAGVVVPVFDAPYAVFDAAFDVAELDVPYAELDDVPDAAFDVPYVLPEAPDELLVCVLF